MVENLSDTLFEKIYSVNNVKAPEIIKDNNEYFIVEIKLIKKNNKPINDPEVLQALNAQINFQTKIENNASILKDISMGGFDNLKMEAFAKLLIPRKN